MKLNLSHKDYLLALGIVVAAIVMLTTWAYTEIPTTASKNTGTPVAPKTNVDISPTIILKKLIDRAELKPFKNTPN